ncbi:hypothetical protein O181_084874 [Austropuccinia psidii MF-1]|uniref:Mitochondrial intermembrane space import and assembly protein 40 n=1 Tax=Austropuccinia psidii MF-1 TaxID=1389203 RepID=A0A9Q3FTX4_9BASI|nr:hypothetical protein [Austropuccinia psidii MF-1]
MSGWISKPTSALRPVSLRITHDRTSLSFLTKRPVRRHAFQPITRHASFQSQSNKSTISGHWIALGKLTLIGFVGVGFGLAAKRHRSSTAHDQKSSVDSHLEKDLQENNEKPEAEPVSNESSEQGAFNPETGEINWDCPCLGGMAHGPCGEQFKAAFSCFVFSEQEPKGVECIDKFKEMQDCFREHPEHYGAELDDSEELPTASELVEQEPTEAQPASTSSNSIKSFGSKSESIPANPSEESRKQAEASQVHQPASQIEADSSRPTNLTSSKSPLARIPT